MNPNSQAQEVVIAGYFATLKDGKVAVLGEATPPTHELVSCQIALSKEEYDLLKALNGKIENVEEIVRAIKSKIKANGS